MKDTTTHRNENWRTKSPEPYKLAKGVLLLSHVKIDTSKASVFDGFQTTLIVDHDPNYILQFGCEKSLEFVANVTFPPFIKANLLDHKNKLDRNIMIFFDELELEFQAFKYHYKDRLLKSCSIGGVEIGHPYKMSILFAEGQIPKLKMEISPTIRVPNPVEQC